MVEETAVVAETDAADDRAEGAFVVGIVAGIVLVAAVGAPFVVGIVVPGGVMPMGG